jgi:ATP-dependent Clp protease protease subunit
MNNFRLSINNPVIIESTPEGETVTYDVFSRMMKERIVFIGGEIMQDNADAIIAQLLWLDNHNNQKDIKIYINSEGGDMQCMNALYDVMQFIKAPVSTFAIGKAFSAAAILLCAGTKGKRYALPNTTIMVHQPWSSGIGGKATDVEIEAKQLKEDKRTIIELLARHSGNTYERVLADCENDFYLTSKQALKYGIIDAITSPQKEIPPLLTEKTIGKK